MGMKTGSGGFQVKELFKKTAIGLSLSAAMMSVALPAMAGANDCAPEDKAKITRVEHPSLRVLDFTKSSEACLKDFATKVSGKYLTLVSESDSNAWHEATVETARKLQDEGKLVAVAYANDTDGRDDTANTMLWANGVERGAVPLVFKNGWSMDHIGPVELPFAQKAIAMMYEEGVNVWNTYLKTTPNLAMNN